MAKTETYTKKATAKILKEVLKINPKASGRTTFDQAFVELMSHWNMELSIETDSLNNTTCTLYRDGDKPHTWEFKDAWDKKAGDWVFDTIYKKVLEDIIKLKLHKRPKLGKRAQAKLAKEKAAAEAKAAKEAMEKQKAEDEIKYIEDLKKRKGNLQVKKSDWKKKGKDISELEKEIVEINNILKKLTKTK